MLVPVDVPNSIAQRLGSSDASRSRRILEALLLEQYRSGEISGGRLGKALGMDFYEREQFLRDHQAFINITPEELDQEVAALERLQAR